MHSTTTPDKSQDIPPSLGEDLYHALTQVDIQRVHTTITIDDFDYITQDVRYIFYNNGPKKMSILPLPAIERKVQRNIKVEDFQTRKLVFIPSSPSADILREASAKILNEAEKKLDNQSQKDVFGDIMETIQSETLEIFKYKPVQSSIKSACDQIAKILEKENFWTENFLRDIFLLADLLFTYKDGFYYPLITLVKPFPPKTYTMVHFSVEKLREYLQEWKKRFKFNFLGKFIFAFMPEIYRGISNHVRIYAPDGLSIKDIEFDFESKSKSENQSESEEIGPEESATLYRCKNYFNITFGLSSLLKTFTLLWWLTILSPLFCGVLYKLKIFPLAVANVILSSNFAFVLLALSATFLVAVGIYTRIAKHFITLHIILIYIVLTIEIFFMIYFN
jgi:hypothetical protein